MRHLVLALMIALLPVRGWVGDAMAAQMLSGRMEAAAAQAQPLPAGQAQAAAMECPGHAAQPQAPEAQTGQPASHEACVCCVTCLVCSSAALAVAGTEAAGHSLFHAAPPAGSAAFASAEVFPLLKPPIS